MRRFRALARFLVVILFVVAVCVFLLVRALEPKGAGGGYIRVDRPTERFAVLQEAETKGYLKSARAVELFANLTRRPDTIRVGTYRLDGNQDGVQNLRALGRPISQKFRFPETNWAKRSANLLEKAEVCPAADYLEEVANPGEHKTDFPLPTDTLEGYLYPDTYDLPPLLGAKGVVGRQLAAFRKKVWEPLNHPKDLHRLITLASLVELETGTEKDRAMIAGVVENRLKKGMPLQIDASLLYGMGKWRRLTFKDYREFDSPYNLYRHKGLPPTPICSPSLASIRAAMAPARHNYVYYVALPNGSSLFAATYEEHKKNIKKRLEALKR